MIAEPLRVVVADDHAIVREGLRGVLQTAGIEVVAEAGDGVQAVAATATHRPDVVLMDLQMPTMGGVEATRRVLAEQPEVAVLVLTMYDDDGAVVDALAAGARGYLLKGVDGHEVVAAVRSVAAGGATFGHGVADHILSRLSRPPDPGAAFPQLTGRERTVLELLVGDIAVPVIARRLGVSDKTVRNVVSNITAKLGVADRDAAAVAARAAGIRPPP